MQTIKIDGEAYEFTDDEYQDILDEAQSRADLDPGRKLSPYQQVICAIEDVAREYR